MTNTVEMGKSGRIVLPKETREKYNLGQKTKFIIREGKGEITLIPLQKHDNPTEKLCGILTVEEPIDDPKAEARRYIRKKLE
ncbi:MAG: AbrB/MazE/SpoVT family DNA-binding domain-containing protein [Candidatus Bathyarchaeota archaeon]|nr:AbrB/MazE/SpoVT family DNA-binding domain-containing protein [Candidatus Bathyarchaeota archaeon]